MKTIETKYFCDRCNSEIDSQVFNLHGVKLKNKVISFSSYEQSKYGYIPTNCVPLRTENAMVVDMVVGYTSNNFSKIHLCTKCTKEFKKFMKKQT